jgi:nicotinamide mononucleotide transporter
MSLIEVLAAITGLACVYLTAKEKIASFPVGIINIALFMYMFYGAKLYADTTLQVIFLGLTLYGWYFWTHGNKNTKSVLVTRDITSNEILASVSIFLCASAVWATGLSMFTDASVPFIDAPVAVASILAQWFLSKKVVQNWLMWIAVDVFSIGLYFYKELYITSALYGIFLVIAIKGFLDWRREQSYVESKAVANA